METVATAADIIAAIFTTLLTFTRGVQRRIYDERRSTVLHDNGIRLVVIRYDQLEHYSCGRLRRDSETDEARLRELLRDFPPE